MNSSDLPREDDTPDYNTREWFKDAANQLIEYSRQSRRYGQLIFLLIILNFGILGVGYPVALAQRTGTSISSSSRQYYVTIFTTLTIFVVVLSLLALVALLLFEGRKRLAEASFQQLSDELQIFAGKQTSTDTASLLRHSRGAIQLYSRTGDLPFAPGRFGVTVYAVVSIAIGFVAVFVSLNAINTINSLPGSGY